MKLYIEMQKMSDKELIRIVKNFFEKDEGSPIEVECAIEELRRRGYDLTVDVVRK